MHIADSIAICLHAYAKFAYRVVSVESNIKVARGYRLNIQRDNYSNANMKR